MGHHVFVSHSSKDKETADAVRVALEAKGVRCWIAPRDILPGASWANSILAAIADSRLMVLILSAHANESPHIAREVERAVNHRVPVAPIRVDDVVPKGELEYFLSASHWMDATTRPIDQHLDRLAEGVKALLAGPPTDSVPGDAPATAPTAAPAAEPARPRRPGQMLVIGAALVVACAAVAIGGWVMRRRAAAEGHQPVPPAPPPVAVRAVGQGRTGELFDRSNSIGLKLIKIAPGDFQMGSPPAEAGRKDDETRHAVRLARPFLLGIYEVTRGQFAAFVTATGYKTDAEREGFAYRWNGRGFAQVYGATWNHDVGFEQDDTHPVVNVSWNDATAFCRWLSEKERAAYRLPTEAEWEYACRAGTQTACAWGDDPAAGAGWCNAADLAAREKFPGWEAFGWSDGVVYTAPAGRFRPNAWGLYDLHGNALEWCDDRFGDYPAGPVTDPDGPDAGTARVLRGGSWADPPAFCRSAARRQHEPDYRSFEIGFRVALDPAGRPAPATRPAAAGG